MNIKRPVMWMMVAFVLGEVAAYQMGMTVWFIIAAALFVFHRKLCPMKHKAHSFSPAVIKTAEGRVDSDFQTDAEGVWNWKDPMMCRVFLLFFCFFNLLIIVCGTYVLSKHRKRHNAAQYAAQQPFSSHLYHFLNI